MTKTTQKNNDLWDNFLKILPVAALIAVPLGIAFYNQVSDQVDCSSPAYQNSASCAAAEEISVKDPEIQQTLERVELDTKTKLEVEEKMSLIRGLKSQIYEKEIQEKLDNSENTSFLQSKESYNQAVLEVLQTLDLKSKKKICENNPNFLPETDTESKIKQICIDVLDEDELTNENNQQVKGISSESTVQLFEIELDW